MSHPQFLLQPLTAAVLAACSSTLVWANNAENSSEHTLHSLAPLVVTAQQANDANGLIVYADPKQPIQPVPATDGADYLQSIMGFNSVNSGAGTNGDVTFRGMFGSRIKILIDGTENLGACPSRMDAPTSYISPESYDRISVIKGPQTVQYANTGSAATVIFERGPETDLSAEKHYRGQASVLLGSYGRLDHNVETAIGDETKYIRLNANRSESEDYQDGNGDTVPSAWERWNTDVALGWTPDENTWLELSGGKADGEAVYAGRDMDGSKFARESLGLRFEKKNLTDVIKKVEGQINYNFNDHVMDNYSLRDVPEADKSMNVTRRTLNTRLAMTSEWDKFQLVTGVDSQQNHHAGGMTSMMMNMPVTTDMKFNSYGAFGELSYQLNDQHKLVSGARLDEVSVKKLAKGVKRTESVPSAFIRLENQHPEQNAKSYIGVGYVERMPDYWELFRTDYEGTMHTFKRLDTEKTLQLDLGYQHQHGALNSWVSAYAGLINDFILMTYDPNKDLSVKEDGHKPNAADSRNVDATIAGAEAGVGYQFTDTIQGDISAMYAWGENTTDNTPLPQIAPLEARVNLRYVQEKYNVGLLWRIVDDQSRISKYEGNIVGYDLDQSKSKGFGTLSINGSYNLREGVDLSVGIDNLLDKAYSEHLNKAGSAGFGFAANEQFNNIGRNYWARMSFKF